MIEIIKFDQVSETNSRPRKTFPVLTVQEGKFVFGDFDGDDEYGAKGNCKLVGLDPVEGVENPDTDNCQYVNFNWRFGTDQNREDAMNKAYKKALVIVKNILGKKGTEAFNAGISSDMTAEDLFDLIKDTLDGQELAFIVGCNKKLNDEGKPQNLAMISPGKTWCRPITSDGIAQLEEALRDADKYTWDQVGQIVEEQKEDTTDDQW